MKNNKKHKSSLRLNNDLSDSKAVTKSTFEWFAFVIIVVVLFVFVFSFVFRISEVTLKNGEQVSVLVSSLGYNACSGDDVAVRNDNIRYTAKVIAIGGQCVTTYDNYDVALDGVLMRNIRQVKSIKDFCGDKMIIPNGYVLVLSYDLDNDGNYITELLPEDSIYGKINSVVYPIKFFNKSVESVRK